MATIPTYFTDFLHNIRLTESQIKDCATGHRTLRQRLNDEEEIRDEIIDTFLQGSYKRHTAIRPTSDGGRSDVDVIVVTNLDSNEWTPQQALDRFKTFLEKHYKGKYRAQGRSWGIRLSYVDIDLVVTSAPSEATRDLYTKFFNMDENILMNESIDKWKAEPLLIPDRKAGTWTKTHPLAQILATLKKNKATNGHFINVVKAIKWWKNALNSNPEHPKSYPLEHLIWQVCPDNIQTVAEGVTLSFEHIRDDYERCIQYNTKPYLPDHGVPEHDVFARVSSDEFAAFYKKVCVAAKMARNAYEENDIRESVRKWRELFGDKFPPPPTESSSSNDDGGRGGYTPRESPSIIGGGRFA